MTTEDWIGDLAQQRIKRGTDFNVTVKYGEIRVMCHWAYREAIGDSAVRHGLVVAEWFEYGREAK